MDPLLEIRRLTKNFGGIVAISDVELSLKRGEILGIIGPNGAGKSTLINLISGVYRPNDGAIIYKGQDVTGLKPNRLVRLGLTRTFQATILYSQATVMENVLRGSHLTRETGFFSQLFHTKKAHDAKIKSLEKSLQYLDFLSLGHVRDQKANNLPYGYQKSLGVALALATEPDLLMLDEPAAGLNMDEAVDMKEKIEKINERGVTLIVVDHNMRFIMSLCHRIVVLNYGEKISEGDPKTIQKDEKVLEAYLGGGHLEIHS